MIWMYLFGDFQRSHQIPQARALVWEFIHFPLHFGLLLLLAAIVVRHPSMLIASSHAAELIVSIEQHRNHIVCAWGEVGARGIRSDNRVHLGELDVIRSRLE
jgi:hypothetical protein